MAERAQLAVKKPEVKNGNSAIYMRKSDHSPSLSLTADRILFLQRTIGNQAVQRLIKSGALQAKLRIGQPGDKYEQEADRVADAVMRMPEPGVQRQVEPEEEETIQTKPLANQITPLVQVQRQEEPEEEKETLQAKPLAEQITPLVQKQVEEEEEEEPVQTKLIYAESQILQRQEEEKEEEELLQPKASPGQTPEVTPDLESRINSIRGSGQPLPKSVRAFFEPRFGYDFKNVRVHTDARAAESARSLNAKAFATGRDIVFGAGHYPPDNIVGRRLLAHELTHVVQQKGLVTLQRKGKKGGKGGTIFKKTKYKSYPVKGKTLKEAVEDMKKTHGEEVGKTEWSSNVQYEYDEKGTIRKAKVEVETTITMPKWPGAKKLSKPAMAEWSRFYKALKKHEKGHADIVRKKLKGLGTKLVGKSKKDAESAYKKALEDLKKASDAYDAITDHGRRQGTVIDLSK